MPNPFDQFDAPAAAPAGAPAGSPQAIMGPPRLPAPQTATQAEIDQEQLLALREKRQKGGDGRKLSPVEQRRLNELSEQGGAAANTLLQYRRADQVLRRSHLTPERSAQIKSSIVPEDAGLFGMIGSKFNRFVNGVSEQEVADFQTLMALQNAQVLDRQLLQKGTQTESDAARLKLTEVSPYKPFEANEAVIRDGMMRSEMATRKPGFYTQWANSYGLNGLDPSGRSVDQAWDAELKHAFGDLDMMRNLHQQGVGEISRDDLVEFHRFAESGATPEQLQTYWLNLTGGRSRLGNAQEVVSARDAGRGVSNEIQGLPVGGTVDIDGYKVRRVK
jgi:hypothetical protein